MITFLLRNAYKTKMLVKYLISGGTAAFVDLLLLYIFTDLFDLWYLLSAVLAFIGAFFVSFFLQKFWTFRDAGRDKMYKQASLYFLNGVINLVLNTMLMYVLVDHLHIWYMLAQFITSGLLAIVSFVIYRFIIFDVNRKADYGQASAQSKNILIAAGIYPPDAGGPASYSQTLLGELPKRGFKAKVVTYGEPVAGEADVKRISRAQSILARYFKYFLAVYTERHWADLIYVQGPVSEGLPAIMAALLSGKKIVMKIVGDYAWEQGVQKHGVTELPDGFQEKRYGFKVELMRKIEHLTAQSTDLIITPSDYLKTLVSKWGIDGDKIKVINNASETPAVPDKDVNRKKLGFSGRTLVSAGRLVPWKGYGLLIDLMPALAEKYSDIRLVIIGDGPEYGNLERKTKENKLEGKVILTGKLNRAETLEYLAAADIFILNTGYEGFSHLLVEAMACGAPVITTTVGGNPEIIEDNIDGLLVPYGNAGEFKATIETLLDDKELVERITGRAREKARGYSKEKMVDALAVEINRLLASEQ